MLDKIVFWHFNKNNISKIYNIGSTLIIFIISSLAIFTLWDDLCGYAILNSSKYTYNIGIGIIIGILLTLYMGLIHRHIGSSITQISNINDNIELKKTFNELKTMTHDYELKHDSMNKVLTNLIEMIDSNAGICMWMKDANDRYIYADRTLRHMLLGKKKLYEVVGKTDLELTSIKECSITANHKLEEILKNLPPSKLPEIPSEIFKDGIVCNITDVITRILKKPCRFHEEVGEYILDVWKTPIFDNDGNVCATVGSLVNITEYKYHRLDMLQTLVSHKKAFRIDHTNNYYIEKYGFGELYNEINDINENNNINGCSNR